MFRIDRRDAGNGIENGRDLGYRDRSRKVDISESR
jgi:hypothetical protein